MKSSMLPKQEHGPCPAFDAQPEGERHAIQHHTERLVVESRGEPSLGECTVAQAELDTVPSREGRKYFAERDAIEHQQTASPRDVAFDVDAVSDRGFSARIESPQITSGELQRRWAKRFGGPHAHPSLRYDHFRRRLIGVRPNDERRPQILRYTPACPDTERPGGIVPHFEIGMAFEVHFACAPVDAIPDPSSRGQADPAAIRETDGGVMRGIGAQLLPLGGLPEYAFDE